MRKTRWAGLIVGLLVLGGGSVGQDKKKDDPKKDDVKKDEPAAKAKGQLPTYWKDIVSEDQKPKIYAVQTKYREKIDKLETEIKSLKEKRDKELLDILSPEQKKRLEDKIKEKAGLKKDG